ncbi:MAG: AraC family transcriptional regulator [bacterium]
MTHLLPREGTVRIGTAIRIPEVLRNFCVDPAEILTEAGLDQDLFEDPDNIISFAARSHLIALCQERTGCEHFGLLVGKGVGLSSLGLVGYLAQNSSSVESALNSLVRYFHLHAQGSIVVEKIEDEMAFLGYFIYQQHVEAYAQIEDAAVAISYNILRTLCGSEWKPIEVCFSHRRPGNIKPYKNFFRAPLRFDSEQSGIFFDVEYLGKPIATADSELHRLLQKQIDQLEVKFVEDFPEQVRRILTTTLLMGHAKADQVAALFSMHSRTLNRRLNDYGMSFKKLADEVRFEMAKQMLETSNLEIREIAAMLDYTDGSAFTKAFRRWSDTTPSRWREKSTV